MSRKRRDRSNEEIMKMVPLDKRPRFLTETGPKPFRNRKQNGSYASVAEKMLEDAGITTYPTPELSWDAFQRAGNVSDGNMRNAFRNMVVGSSTYEISATGFRVLRELKTKNKNRPRPRATKSDAPSPPPPPPPPGISDYIEKRRVQLEEENGFPVTRDMAIQNMARGRQRLDAIVVMLKAKVKDVRSSLNPTNIKATELQPLDELLDMIEVM